MVYHVSERGESWNGEIQSNTARLFDGLARLAKKMGVTRAALCNTTIGWAFFRLIGRVARAGAALYRERFHYGFAQILSLKSLGFSLEDIKQRLPSLEAPDDVANALAEQAGEESKRD